MPPYLPRQKFPSWLPDVSDQLPGVSSDVQNVIPKNDGWGPFPSFVPFSQSLPAPCRGFFYGRNADGSVTIFAGTAAAKLYQLNNNTLTWVDVSQGGATYAALSANRNWSFVQFNSVVIATQGNANMQAVTLPNLAFSAFADLGGSPPQSDFVAVVNRFLVATGIPGNPYRAQWCDLDNITQWTAGVGQADFQDLPDGGRTLGVAGFDLYAVIFQDSMARLMTYAPGSPVIFTITKITGGDGNGLFAPYGNLQLTIATTDPAASRIYVGFKSTGGQAGQFDTVLIFDWRLERWSRAFQSAQYLTTMSRPGLTLEGMDALTPGAVSITGAASNGGPNLIRLTVSSTAGMATAQQQTVFGKWNVTQIVGSAPFLAAINNVVNTQISNWGTWAITIIDGTHVDLVGSVFAGTYSSGGILGANIELIPFSFDTVSSSTLPSLSAINSNGMLGFYNGPNSQAIIETGEQGTPEQRLWIEGFRVISDAPTIFGSVSYRDNPQASYNYTTEVGLDGFTGTILVAGGGIDTRYSRGKIRIPAATVWTYALGIEPAGDVTGRY